MTITEFKSIVEARGPVHRDGRDWRGRCPVRNDTGRRGNLAFREGDAGQILIRCWSGCKFESVVALHHVPALEKLIEIAKPVQLIIVDPLTSFLGDTDQHRNGEVRAALARFSALAERHGCASVGISHLAKDAGKAAIHRCIGSVAFTATARAVWLVSEDHDDEERRLFVPVKNNLSPMAKSLAFRIADMAVQWEAGQFDYAADEVLTDKPDAEDSGSLADACQ